MLLAGACYSARGAHVNWRSASSFEQRPLKRIKQECRKRNINLSAVAPTVNMSAGLLLEFSATDFSFDLQDNNNTQSNIVISCY